MTTPEPFIPEPHQATASRFLAARWHGLLGDVRGLGKTVSLILAAQQVGAQTVDVFCPASVRSSWLYHVRRHFGYERGWRVMSYAQAANAPRRAVDLIGLDEVHFLKTMESGRTQAIFGQGNADGHARRAQFKWASSGTVSPNGRPIELFPVLKALHPAFARVSLAQYASKFCGAYFDGRGMNNKGATCIDELARELDGFMLRRTVQEVYPNRKAPLISTHAVDLTAADLRAIIAAEDEIGGREVRISSTYDNFSQLGDTSRLLRLLGMAKVRHTADYVTDLLQTVQKVVVFAHHKDVIAALKAAFDLEGYNPVVYAGGMSDGQKDAVVRHFQSPECRVFIGQRQAAGTGINGLQRVCSTMVIAEPSWTPGETDQLVGRLDRMGQEDDLVRVHILYAPGTLDEVVTHVHERKTRNNDRLMRGGAEDPLDRWVTEL